MLVREEVFFLLLSRCHLTSPRLSALNGSRTLRGLFPRCHILERGGTNFAPALACFLLVFTHNSAWCPNPSRIGQLTVMLNCWEACTPVLSVTVSINVNVPVAVGVPLMVVPPFDPLVSARPGGSCPAVIDQV
jgi:hypothetical protein